jgi:hypothetical protein
MVKRELRLGIDYGTSASKMVFRDPLAPGGEKTYVVVRDGNFRIPSSVALTAENLVFGCSPGACELLDLPLWYESVKMRVAGEATSNYRKYCYGPLPNLPRGLTARDIATLTVWYLIGEGHYVASRFLRAEPDEVATSVTLGIPMSFFEDGLLRRTFLSIARRARSIYIKYGRMVSGKIQLDEARKIIEESSHDNMDEAEIPKDALRNWIRSEAEAGLCLAVKSPGVPEGAYAEIDIGAGTTHASVFWIWSRFRGGRWLKDRLAFYGVRSEPVGMDAVDAVLAPLGGLALDECLRLRGEERETIDRVGAGSLDCVVKEIRETYIRAWRRACLMLNLAEREGFRHHDIFVAGGGSLIPEITTILATHPDGYERPLSIRRLGKPDDLLRTDGKAILGEDIPFLVVAYGLSYNALEVPEAYMPGGMHPQTIPEKKFVGWEEM